jgi:hypothetical protein
VIAVLALALALRLPALGTEFWLDEIWSWVQFASQAKGPLDIFFGRGFAHDNNHPLNTLWLWALGEREGWAAYRGLALAGGMVAVASAIALGRRFSQAAGIVSGLLFAGSFLLVVYSTEARGYGTLVAFALLAALALDAFLARPRAWPAAAFWLSVFGGVSSHLSFVHFYVGALLWSAWRLGRARDARALAWLHAPPLLYLALVYALVVRSLELGGGPSWPWQRVADEALAWTFGYPTGVVPAAAALVGVAALVAWDCWRLRAEGSDEWVLSVGTIVLAPAATLALAPGDFVFARYFVVPLSFLLLAGGRALARLRALPRAGPALVTVLVVLFLVGNLAHLRPFWDHGRGGASWAVARMRALPGDDASPIFVTSRPEDNWAIVPIYYYEQRLPAPHRLRYRPASRPPPQGFDWLILQTPDPDPPPPAPEVRLGGQRLVLDASYPAYGPSGMHWFLYRRAKLEGEARSRAGASGAETTIRQGRGRVASPPGPAGSATERAPE